MCIRDSGNIYYTKTGTGKPLLLVHDLTHASSSCEWDSLIPLLKEHYTVYTIDLLGCGRSEKPNLTYTNFLYVQLLNDFVKSEIGRRTNILATGASAPIVTMACGYNPDLFEQMMFINPDSLLSCSHIPGKSARYYKFILDLPIIGTLLYNFASARSIISRTFSESYFYNPYDVNPHYIDKYHESAHLGDSPKSVYASVQCNYTKCNITKTLEKIDNSIYTVSYTHLDVYKRQNQDLPTLDDVAKVQEHNEREKDSYSNQDIDTTQTYRNIHFKAPTDSYAAMFDQMIADGVISTRCLLYTSRCV